ncbi:MAG: GNAT family N-acetyltransferase [Candidatus Promineifilaceae bacterium]
MGRVRDLEIRPVEPDDAADLYVIVSDPRVARTTVQLPSMEFAETQAWLATSQPGRYRLVAAAGGRVIGSGGLTVNQNPRRAHSAKFGLIIHPNYWNQGIGTALTAAALDLADNWLDMRRVELDVFTHNPAAVRVYEKLGFQVEGTRRAVVFQGGQFHDEFAMARLSGCEHLTSAPAAEPLPPEESRRPIKDIRIRPPRIEDARPLYALFRDPRVSRTTLQLPSQELPRTEGRLRDQNSNVFRYLAEVEGQVVGQISIHRDGRPRLAHAAGLGMMVHPDYWCRGVGTALIAASVDLADNWLNLKRLYLEVNTDNPAGLRLYQKFGFEIEGAYRFHAFGDGRWADSYFMARVL